MQHSRLRMHHGHALINTGKHTPGTPGTLQWIGTAVLTGHTVDGSARMYIAQLQKVPGALLLASIWDSRRAVVVWMLSKDSCTSSLCLSHIVTISLALQSFSVSG